MEFALDPDQGEGVTTDGAAGRLDYRQRSGGGDGRIHRVAATAQHGDAGFGRQGLRGSDHALAGEHALALGGVGILMGGEIEHGENSIQKLTGD